MSSGVGHSKADAEATSRDNMLPVGNKLLVGNMSLVGNRLPVGNTAACVVEPKGIG
jgi:hypothetical protein